MILVLLCTNFASVCFLRTVPDDGNEILQNTAAKVFCQEHSNLILDNITIERKSFECR